MVERINGSNYKYPLSITNFEVDQKINYIPIDKAPASTPLLADRPIVKRNDLRLLPTQAKSFFAPKRVHIHESLNETHVIPSRWDEVDEILSESVGAVSVALDEIKSAQELKVKSRFAQDTLASASDTANSASAVLEMANEPNQTPSSAIILANGANVLACAAMSAVKTVVGPTENAACHALETRDFARLALTFEKKARSRIDQIARNNPEKALLAQASSALLSQATKTALMTSIVASNQALQVGSALIYPGQPRPKSTAR